MHGTSISGRNLFLSAFLINNSPILDNQVVGPFRALVGRTIGTGDTALTHTLGRIPNGYIAYRAGSPGILYDASTGTSAWTASNITIRASSAGTYSLLIF